MRQTLGKSAILLALLAVSSVVSANNYVSVTFVDDVGDRDDPPGDLSTIQIHFLEAQLPLLRVVYTAAPGRQISGDPDINGGDVWLGSNFVAENDPDELLGLGLPRTPLQGPTDQIVSEGWCACGEFSHLRIGDRVQEFSQAKGFFGGFLGVFTALGPDFGDEPNGFLSSVAVVSTHPMQDYYNLPPGADQDYQGIDVDGTTIFRIRYSSGAAVTTVSGPAVTGIARDFDATLPFYRDRASLLIETASGPSSTVEDRSGLITSVGFPSTNYTAELRGGPIAIFFYRPRDMTAARLGINLAETTGNTPVEARLVLTDEAGNRNATPAFPLTTVAQDFDFRTSDFTVSVFGSNFDQTNVSNFELEVFSTITELDPVPASIIRVDNPNIELREPKVRLEASTRIVRPGEEIELVWDSAEADQCVASGGWTGNRPLRGTETVIATGESFSMTCSGPNSETTPSTDVANTEFPAWTVEVTDPEGDHSGSIDVTDVRLDVTEAGLYRVTLLASELAPFVEGETRTTVRFVNGDALPFTSSVANFQPGPGGSTIIESPNKISIEGICAFGAWCDPLTIWQLGDRVSTSNRDFGPFEDNVVFGASVVSRIGETGFDRITEDFVQIARPDTDGDSVWDGADAFPNDPNETVDTDNDGIGNNADLDDDNDQLSDVEELSLGTDPLLADTDGDGTLDGLDYYPLLPYAPSQQVLRRTGDARWFGYAISADSQAVTLEDRGPLNVTRNMAYQTVARSDFDGDGVPDLLLRDETGAENGRWVLATVVGSIVTSQGFIDLARNPNWQLIATEDFDGDGGSDVLLRNSSDGRWQLNLLDGGTLIAKRVLEMSTDLADGFAGAGDFNGDGTADILLRRADGSWLLYAVDGVNPPIEGTPLMTTNTNFSVEALADFDGNSRTDVLLRRTDGRWYLYLLDGATVIGGGPPALSQNRQFTLASAADFSGDDRADILLRRNDGRWYLYAMDGNAVVAEGDLDMTRNPNFQLISDDDFNGDGNSDLLLRRNDGRWVLYMIDGTVPQVIETGVPGLTRNPDWVVQ